MRRAILTIAAAVMAVVGTSGTASAQFTYVGSWRVDQGPSWPSQPLDYTGQTAAAAIFGGSASDYFISTASSDPNTVNFLAWYSTWGGACGGAYPCGTQYAQNYFHDANGNDRYDSRGDVSAYVADWAVGNQYTNYAFKVTATPEPATLGLMLLGFGAVGISARRKQQKA